MAIPANGARRTWAINSSFSRRESCAHCGGRAATSSDIWNCASVFEQAMVLALVTTATAVALCYGASRHQRWFAKRLPPSVRIAAALIALSGLLLWAEEMGAGAGFFAWLMTLMLSAIAATAVSAAWRS